MAHILLLFTPFTATWSKSIPNHLRWWDFAPYVSGFCHIHGKTPRGILPVNSLLYFQLWASLSCLIHIAQFYFCEYCSTWNVRFQIYTKFSLFFNKASKIALKNFFSNFWIFFKKTFDKYKSIWYSMSCRWGKQLKLPNKTYAIVA